MRLVLLLLLVCVAGCGQTVSAGNVQRGYVMTPDGVRLYFEKSGQGSTVVISPGGLALEPWLRPLDHEFTYIAYDPRNRGRSDMVEDLGRVGVLRDLDDLETVRAHFGVERFSPVGWSYLGAVAAAYALRHPDRIDRLVLIGAAPFDFGIQYAPEYRAPSGTSHLWNGEEVRLQELRASGADRRDPGGFCIAQNDVWVRQMSADRTTLARVAGFPERICAHPNEWPANFFPHLGRLVETYPELMLDPPAASRISAPTMVVHGQQDRNVSIGAGVDWAYYVPDARLLRINPAAHLVVGEQPAVVRDIAEFLGGTWPAKATKPTGPAVRVN